MRASIIIPAFNAAQTLGRTLDSIMAQTHGEWEAIVVDDGSSDDTAQIAERLVARDSRVQLVTQANGGESSARNAGIESARFEWMLFLDADDWISPVYLERMVAALANDPSLDAIHCLHARVAADGALVEESYQPPIGDMFSVLARRAAFPVHACVVKRELVERVGRFDTSLRTCPDWDLWQRIARTGARFGAVREVLAYYRMSEHGTSMNAHQLFADGLRVLRRGHGPDARLSNVRLAHTDGEPPDQVPTQMFYLLAWSAGLLIGSGRDANSLLDLVNEDHYPTLNASAIAQCLYDSVPLPSCQAPTSWPALWIDVQPLIEAFLSKLEAQSRAPALAQQSLLKLRQMVLHQSATWKSVVQELDRVMTALDAERRNLHGLRAERDSLREGSMRDAAERDELRERLRQEGLAGDSLRMQLGELQDQLSNEKDARAQMQLDHEQTQAMVTAQQVDLARLAAELITIDARLKESSAAANELRMSPEHRLGDLLLNRMRLRAPVLATERARTLAQQQLAVAHLAMERHRTIPGGGLRVIASICDVFPIYSQTFVHEELTHLARNGFEVRVVYSHLDSRQLLRPQHDQLWHSKRRLHLHQSTHERDFAHYQQRMGGKVETLVERLCEASGLTRDNVVHHGNFLQAFTFTRMVEAYRPHYLHSYFFYDRSLMSLVAGTLLGIPRGISCYSDHLLADYELKVVPLHLATCDIVIATSLQIKQDLVAMTPSADPARILVKPNGVDTVTFPVVERAEPSENQPYRIVCVSRVEPKKGLMDLVEAVGMLRRRGVQVDAHIVGTVDDWSHESREYNHRLTERITELDLWGIVHLEGRQPLEGVLRFLGLSQLLVLPFVVTPSGDRDGIPTALLEGMSTGLPVVATDAGSIAEVVRPDVEGILVSQRDPAALADAIEELLHDAARRARYGRAAAARVRDRYDAVRGERVFHERIRSVLAARVQ